MSDLAIRAGLRRRGDRRRGRSASAIARDSRATQRCRSSMVEARDDVGDGTSKANTAILHTGFDAKPGTLESRLVRRGYELLSALRRGDRHPGRAHAARCSWPGPRRSSTPCPAFEHKAEQNGYGRCELVDADEVYRQVPALGDGALGGLTVPGRVDHSAPGPTNLALATEARLAGRRLLLRPRVDAVDVGPDATTAAVRRRRASRPAGSSTRPGSAPTSSTRCSAPTGSPSPRAAASCSSSTSWRAAVVDKIVLPVPSPAGQGRADQPDHLRQRHARPDRRGPRRTALPPAPPRRASTSCSAKGRAADAPAPRRRRSPRATPVCGPPSTCDDYLIEASTRTSATCSSAASAPPGSPRRWRSPSTSAGCSPTPGSGPQPARRPARAAADAEPRRGVLRARTRTPSASPPTRRTGGSSASASGSRPARSATRSRRPSRPRTVDGLRRRTRAMNGRCQGFFCGARSRAAR